MRDGEEGVEFKRIMNEEIYYRTSFCSAYTVGILLWSLLFLIACASTATTYIHSGADFSAIEKVAVLPFTNFTEDQHAGQKIQDLFIIELLSEDMVGVVESGEVFRVLAENNVRNVEQMSKEMIRKIGESLGAQALILGTVQEFQIERIGSTPSASVILSFKMIETESGVVIWTTSVSREGAGLATKLFGMGTAQKGKIARKLVRKAIKTLIK